MFNVQKIGFALVTITLLNTVSPAPAQADAVDDLSQTITNGIMGLIFGGGKKKTTEPKIETVNIEIEKADASETQEETIEAPLENTTQINIVNDVETVKPIVENQSKLNLTLKASFEDAYAYYYLECGDSVQCYEQNTPVLNYSDKFYNNISKEIKNRENNLGEYCGAIQDMLLEITNKMIEYYPKSNKNEVKAIVEAVYFETNVKPNYDGSMWQYLNLPQP